MTVSVQKAETNTPVPPAATAPDAEQESFVINLCSSTTPMALTQPQLAELKQFTFFVSRRLEDGRERFRLHMGYFDSLLQAEEMLAVVRDLYPGAWAGEAPGKRLRARAAAAKAAPVAVPVAPKPAAVATPAPAPTPKPVAPTPPIPAPAATRAPARAAAPMVSPTAAQLRAAPELAAGPSAELLARMPTLSAAPEPAATSAAAPFVLELMPDLPPPAPVAEPAAQPVASTPAAVTAAQPDATALVPVATPLVLAEPQPVSPAAAIAQEAPVAKPVARTPAPRRDAAMPFDQRSNVREVLKSLDESARHSHPASPSIPQNAPVVPAAAAAAATAVASAPAVKAVKSAPTAAKAPAVAPPVVPEGPVVRQPGVLPESQVMHLLEEKRGGDPLNTTSTPAAFSVQLQWSVQPIDLARVPPLAIFGAYTLYTVEGSREGRRWYGLRLGFFSDANSAKQVAQYVRSEFSSVAVVPVSLKERDGASGASGTAPAAQKTTERLPDQSGEFKLLDDTGAMPKLTPPAAAQMPSRAAVASAAAKVQAAKSKAAAAARSPAGRAGQKATKTRGNRVHAHDKRGPKTLEETLEILGADELQIEGARRQLISEGMIKHADVKVQKNSPFTRLLDRLAERNR